MAKINSFPACPGLRLGEPTAQLPAFPAGFRLVELPARRGRRPLRPPARREGRAYAKSQKVTAENRLVAVGWLWY